MADLCGRKIGEDKADSMLWLDFSKIWKTDRGWKCLKVNGRCYVESKFFLFNSQLS